MISNAAILRIDTPGMPDPTGGTSWTNGSAVSIPCLLDDPTNAQKMTLGDLIANTIGVLYVPLRAMPTAPTPKVRLTISLASMAPVTYEVVYVRIRSLNGLDHYEAFLQVLF